MTKRRVLPFLICGAVGLLFFGVRLSQAQQEELDSLIVCKETQKLVWENAFVRVIEAHSPPGNAEPKHKHARGVTIALSEHDNETLSYPDRQVSRRHSKFGEVRWTEPTIHEVRNVGKTEQHVIRIELK